LFVLVVIGIGEWVMAMMVHQLTIPSVHSLMFGEKGRKEGISDLPVLIFPTTTSQ